MQCLSLRGTVRSRRRHAAGMFRAARGPLARTEELFAPMYRYFFLGCFSCILIGLVKCVAGGAKGQPGRGARGRVAGPHAHRDHRRRRQRRRTVPARPARRGRQPQEEGAALSAAGAWVIRGSIFLRSMMAGSPSGLPTVQSGLSSCCRVKNVFRTTCAPVRALAPDGRNLQLRSGRQKVCREPGPS